MQGGRNVDHRENPRNIKGRKMQDIPPGLYKTLIQIVVRTIMNHHKQDISGDYMKLVIHWVEDLAIDVPHLLAKKLDFAL